MLCPLSLDSVCIGEAVTRVFICVTQDILRGQSFVQTFYAAPGFDTLGQRCQQRIPPDEQRMPQQNSESRGRPDENSESATLVTVCHSSVEC
jgi:hypothetical protein